MATLGIRCDRVDANLVSAGLGEEGGLETLSVHVETSGALETETGRLSERSTVGLSASRLICADDVTDLHVNTGGRRTSVGCAETGGGFSLRAAAGAVVSGCVAGVCR